MSKRMKCGNLQKEQLVKSIKFAAAAFAAIALAGELGLQYSSTAGIVTILSIQNTKQETIKSAGRRWCAFLCAIILAKLCFSAIDYNLWAFGMYLFLFALLCLWAGWGEAIAMDSVLISHFLSEQSMEPMMIVNEAMLLLIGIGMGILSNLHLHKKETQFQHLSGKVDDQIKLILYTMSEYLSGKHRGGHEIDACFIELERAIEEAGDCALSNYRNVLFLRDTCEIDYIVMREQQSFLLKEMDRNIARLHYLPMQTGQIAGLLQEIGCDFHRDNTVAELMERQDKLLKEMKEQELPQSREEFEARAILFYILMQIKQFLGIKREYVLKLHVGRPPYRNDDTNSLQ